MTNKRERHLHLVDPIAEPDRVGAGDIRDEDAYLEAREDAVGLRSSGDLGGCEWTTVLLESDD